MKKTFVLNDLASELDDAKVAQWHINPGQFVAFDDDLIEVVTDKAAITLACPCEGKIISCDCKIGDSLQGHQPIITIEMNN